MNVRPDATMHGSWFGVANPDLGWVPPLRYLARRRELLRVANRWAAGARVLEIGCGAGALLHDLSRMGFCVTGLETSDEARALAISLRDAESGRWEIHDSPSRLDPPFDVIGAFDVLEHIDDDIGTLQQWRTLAGPDAVLCVSVPAHQTWWGPGDVWAGHFRRYDRADVDQLFRKSGWLVEAVIPYGFPVASLTEWLGRAYYSRALVGRGLDSRTGATAKSGIDRGLYLRFWPMLGSELFGAVVRFLLALQSLPWPEKWHAGYIAIARIQR